MMKQPAMVFAVLLVCGFYAVTAAGDEKPKQEKVFKATVDKDGVQRVELLGASYFFTPDHIIVRVNVPVELTVRKESGIVPHSIVIKAPEAGIDVNVPLADKPKVIRFTPARAGTYPFYCDKKLLFFENHRKKGMEGTLEVTE